MRNSDLRLVAALALSATLVAPSVEAQHRPEGFLVERFNPSPAGGGWFVTDSLDMHGGLGGTMALTVGYAHDPLRVTDGTTRLAVVSDQAFAGFGFAATYDRLRLSLQLNMPLLVQGQSGMVGNTSYVGPNLDLGTNPDSITDARVGVDARVFGTHDGPVRLGIGGYVFFPNKRSPDYTGYTPPNYNSDGVFRAMLNALVAGDLGTLVYAGQAGIHVRPLDDTPAVGPRGSELVFGLAAGLRFLVGSTGSAAVVVGPELFGQSAFGSFLGRDSTGFEALLTGRIEGTAERGTQVRVKLGGGPGISQHFGTPEWRAVLGLEVFDRGGLLER